MDNNGIYAYMYVYIAVLACNPQCVLMLLHEGWYV